MSGVVKAMDSAMKSMNLEKISGKFQLKSCFSSFYSSVHFLVLAVRNNYFIYFSFFLYVLFSCDVCLSPFYFLCHS